MLSNGTSVSAAGNLEEEYTSGVLTFDELVSEIASDNNQTVEYVKNQLIQEEVQKSKTISRLNSFSDVEATVSLQSATFRSIT